MLFDMNRGEIIQQLKNSLRTLLPERFRIPSAGRRAAVGSRYQWMIEPFARMCGGIAGKRVLEVGTDRDCGMLHLLTEAYGAGEAIGINPGLPAVRISSRARRESRDARDTGLPGEQFDVVLSCATFEHVHNLDTALSELFRLTRPGGMLMATAGPIWSAPWGHHLHCVADGELLTFSRHTFIPPWGHLLLDAHALCEALTPAIGFRKARAVADYVAETPDQNRLFRQDYYRIVECSPWAESYIFDQVNMEMLGKYKPLELCSWRRRVQEKYPGHGGFEISDIGMILHREPVEGS